MARKNATPFEHVSEITNAHAEKFVETIFAEWSATGIITAAIDESGAMEWPQSDALGANLTSDQGRYLATQDEIANRIEQAIRPALADVFRKVAASVLRVEATHA